MKMSIKTSKTIVFVIVNNVTCIIIIIFMDGAHINLISAGISLSCGKGRMDIRVVFQTNTTAASSTMTFLFTKFRSLHFLPVKSSRKPSTLVIIIYVYSFGQLLVIYKFP